MTATHVTPLTRSQLLDLETLVHNLTSAVLRQDSVPLTPVSFSTDADSNAFVPLTSSLGAAHKVPALSPSSLSCVSAGDAGARPSSHPVLRGEFVDVFTDPLTRHTWRLHDKLLYLMWWSYRPPCCSTCGMQDAWVPSGDSELKCAQCGAEAGSTRLNDVVEDLPGEGEGQGEEDDEGGSNNDFNTQGEDAMQRSHGHPISWYHFFYQCLQRVVVPEGSGGPVLPTTEALPAVLRAAYDMAVLLCLPGMTPGGTLVVRAASLYLSLVLHRYTVPFPLFVLASRDGESGDLQGGVVGCSLPSLSDASLESSVGNRGSLTGEGVDSELQWVDVEMLAALFGVSLADFFESPNVSAQYLQNIMTVAAAYAVPSLLWHPARVPGRVELVHGLSKRRRTSPAPYTVHSPCALSPEHTAMVVVLELARQLDSQPIAAVSSSTAAAAQHAHRLGHWLDTLGLYPARRVYRPANFFEDPAEFQESLSVRCAVDDPFIVAAGASCSSDGDAPNNPHPLTTPASPFYGIMEYVLPSPCANAVLYVLATAFHMPPLVLVEQAVRSGIYGGPTRFVEVLRAAAERGDYQAMPLICRLSPISSCWRSVYLALHSDDRLPLLTALHHITVVRTGSRERFVTLCRILQRILLRHHASSVYLFAYVLRVVDEAEKHFNGIYFLSSLQCQGGLATYTCLRSGRKTITFNTFNRRIALGYLSAKERSVEHLDAHFVGPVIAVLESGSAKILIETAMGCNGGTGSGQWAAVVRSLDRCGRVRRRMRVPMLASRLDALASIREAVAVAHHPVACAGTLVGLGEIELILTSPPVVDVMRLRYELQHNLLSLPSASLLFGYSDNRVIATYASLIALLEYVTAQTRQEQAKSTSPQCRTRDCDRENHHGDCVEDASGRQGGSYVGNWVEELLYDIVVDGYESDGRGDTAVQQFRRGQRSSGPRSPWSAGGVGGVFDSVLSPPMPLTMTPVTRPVNSPPVHFTVHPNNAAGEVTNKPPPSSASLIPPLELGPPATFSFPPSDEQKDDRELVQNSQDMLVLQHLQRIPPYWEVLLGVSDMAALHTGDSGGGHRWHLRSRGKAAVNMGSVVQESAVSLSPFDLFSADECRKRLHRLLRFVEQYKLLKSKLQRQAEAGTLLPATVIPAAVSERRPLVKEKKLFVSNGPIAVEDENVHALGIPKRRPRHSGGSGSGPETVAERPANINNHAQRSVGDGTGRLSGERGTLRSVKDIPAEGSTVPSARQRTSGVEVTSETGARSPTSHELEDRRVRSRRDAVRGSHVDEGGTPHNAAPMALPFRGSHSNMCDGIDDPHRYGSVKDDSSEAASSGEDELPEDKSGLRVRLKKGGRRRRRLEKRQQQRIDKFGEQSRGAPPQADVNERELFPTNSRSLGQANLIEAPTVPVLGVTASRRSREEAIQDTPVSRPPAQRHRGEPLATSPDSTTFTEERMCSYEPDLIGGKKIPSPFRPQACGSPTPQSNPTLPTLQQFSTASSRSSSLQICDAIESESANALPHGMGDASRRLRSRHRQRASPHARFLSLASVSAATSRRSSSSGRSSCGGSPSCDRESS